MIVNAVQVHSPTAATDQALGTSTSRLGPVTTRTGAEHDAGGPTGRDSRATEVAVDPR